MIRVLHIVGKMDRGGIETFLMNIYRNIDRQKIQFDFLLHTDEECDYNAEIRSLGGKIFSVIPRRQGVLKNRKSLKNFFLAHPEYKIIHQHLGSLSYSAPLKVAKKLGVPIRIVHGHSTQEGGSPLNRYIHQWNQLWVKHYATDYFACSDTAAKWLFGKKQYAKREFTIINNGIEAEKFKYNAHIRNEIRKELGVENKFVVGHVGRFTFAKNHYFLLKTFQIVLKKSKNAMLVLVGDGELREDIVKQIKKLGLQDKVILTGKRSDIANLMQAMDIFVMPSHYEGLPVTLVEAQASGLSCIVSDNITRNVNITELIENVSLNKGAQYWAEKINSINHKNHRPNTLQQIIDGNFDVKCVSDILVNYYVESSRKNNNDTKE